ncbi:hypothetical protein B857_01947 [Solibacillus isronensis B3W22]|uniref:Uncharacterized protein n=1 Tax=Solibacillus isronensis B3W22 TaxID=1224748 RepID=K1LM90_9BACL|nr:hypothetical protein [Solibacillus isronensis]AMO87256.1 hypothetical protein SOLI23_17390 [Solibacillus silvestris]EKB45349.1 hypothetical protein B857_01947 [Solibacillus isronensis B3W22]
MSIQYNNYSSVTDYIDRNAVYASNQSLYASKLTVIRGALLVGLAPKAHLKLTKELVEWKISTMLAFIDTKSPFTIQNADELEMSERVTVAYFIGMVFAQIHMQSQYNVRHIEHLKNPGITPTSLPGDLKNPDLWGLNHRTGNSYLVEAKGSTVRKEYFDNQNVRKADSQLKAITQIDYTVTGATTTYNQASLNLEKLIIATHPNLNDEMMQHIIDPMDEEDKVVKVSGDEMVYKHYSQLVKLFGGEEYKTIDLEDLLELENLPKLMFRVIDFDAYNCSIGLLDEIYQILEPLVVKEEIVQEDLQNINKNVSLVLDRFEKVINDNLENEQFSIGIDGVIVLAKS